MSLEQVTQKKIDAIETYIEDHQQEIDGICVSVSLTPQVLSVEATITDPILESMFELKVGKMMSKMVQIWSAVASEETVSNERQGILIKSMRKHYKAGSPFTASGVSRTTSDTLTKRNHVPGSPLKVNMNKNGVAFPIRSASPEKVAEMQQLSNSQTESMKDEAIFE